MIPKRGAHATLAVVERSRERRLERFEAVAVTQFAQTAFAGVVAGNLRAQIAAASLRRARVRAKQRDDFIDDAIPFHDAHRGNDESFGVEIGGIAGHRARHGPADVGVVRFVRGVADEPALVEDRPYEGDVVEMRPGDIGIVRDPHLAFARAAVLSLDDFEHPLQSPRQRSEMNWYVFGLRDQTPEAVEQRARVIETFFDVRRICGVAHRDAHLFGRVDQGVLDHLDRDEIGHDVFAARCSTRKSSSTPADQSGAIYAVLS